MGSFKSHKLKSEKPNKILKHRQLRKIASLLRYVEMCVVLFLISRVSFQHLPVALKGLSEYFSGFMVSPRFVFLIGNVIIIALLAQSGQFSGKPAPAEPDFYLEFLQNSTVNHQIQDEQKSVSTRKENSVKVHRRIDGSITKNPEKQSTNGSMIKNPEKQSTNGSMTKHVEKQSTNRSLIKHQENQSMNGSMIKIKHPEKQSMSGSIIKIKHPEKQSTSGSMIKIKHPEKQSMRKTTGLEIVKDHQIQDDQKKAITITESGENCDHRIDGSTIKIKHPEKQSTRTATPGLEIVEVKDYRRCPSEIARRVQSEKPQRVLQRCETENKMRSGEGETERVGMSSYPEDRMNNDDFRRTVEAFIARQQRLREQELQAISS